MALFVILAAYREGKSEDGAFFRCVLSPDLAAMGMDNAAADGEPKPSALLRVITGIELIKDALFLALGNTGAIIGHNNMDIRFSRNCRNSDRCARRSIFGSIFQQVDQHLLDQQPV